MAKRKYKKPKQIMKTSEFLVGMKINKLTLKTKLETIPRQHQRGIFVCDCGKEKEITLKFVLRNTTKTCGCFMEDRINTFSIGERVGCLVILKKTRDGSAKDYAKWRVKCDCGREKEIGANQIRSAKGKMCSCGATRDDLIKTKDLQPGMKFSEFTLILPISSDYYLVECSCGSVTERKIRSIVRLSEKSCGCRRYEFVSEASTKHGWSKPKTRKEYNIWLGMKKRCSEGDGEERRLYYHRGIRVCQEWIDSFERFHQDMGPRPSIHHSIDRINNDGNYEPSNCRWATPREQNRNKSTNVWITFRGETKILTDWLREFEMCYNVHKRRLNKGMTPQESFEETLKQRREIE